MIELQCVSAGYPGRPVLRDVSIAFRPGQVTVLAGPNGSGKSTLLKTALGLLPRQAGQILYDGTPLERLTTRQVAQKAALMPQTRSTPSITAQRMVLHGRFPYLSFPRSYTRADLAAARRAMEAAGCADLADRPMPELSGGQRQKVYLAMVLAQATPTVFLDEPVTYLDIAHQMRLMAAARRLADEGRAVVMVLHDLSLALRQADRLAVLQQGRLCALDAPERLYESGVLDGVFGVRVRRAKSASGWHYYCEPAEEVR